MRRKKQSVHRYSQQPQQGGVKPSTVTFGDPEPVAYWGSYNGTLWNDYSGYYIPPIERSDLVKLSNMAAYHGAILRARVNMIASGFTGGGGLTHAQVYAAVMNLLLFGDTGLLKIRNGFGRINRLAVLPSLYLRRNRQGETVIVQSGVEDVTYGAEEVVFIAQYDPQQQVYGIPDYMHGMESAMLNVNATRFRICYYKNGAHMGYVFFTNDPNMDPEFEQHIRTEIGNSRGAGNFKSMFINIPGADKDAIKIIPIGDSGTKDEFLNVKNVTAQDQLVAHRFPPGLAGIIPENTAGLGDPLKSREAYYRDEVIPMRRFLMDAINGDAEIRALGQVVFDLSTASITG
ncbi:phage portal protein [Edwardsiella tarda]|uniref:phage portal protein n=1 Tax=Edwardsiella tarda TaxID=636 RepID=UPI003C6F1500